MYRLLTGAASVESAKDDHTQHSRLDSRRGFFYYRILQFMLTLGLRWGDDFQREYALLLKKYNSTNAAKVILNNFCWLQKELR